MIANYNKKKGALKFCGEPTENAIVRSAVDNNINKIDLEKEFPRVQEIPFESSRKLMTTIHKTKNGYRIITKGAPDVLLKRCSKDYNNGHIICMNSSRIEQIKKVNQNMAEKALRVLAVAYLDVTQISNNIRSEEIERNLIFVRINRNDRPAKRRCKRSCSYLCKSWY